MTGDEYILSVLSGNQVDTSDGSPAVIAAQAVYPILAGWAGNQLVEVKFSGSHAKGTGVAGRADTDLFISLKPDTTNTLKEIYYSLDKRMKDSGYGTKLQNVSIRVRHNGVEIDLVPGVRYAGNSDYHWLYVKKSGKERTQTNIDKHIEIVVNSGRINEIRALKTWAHNHRLDFPSIYLELTVLESLSGHRYGNLSANVWHVLDHLQNTFVDATIIDPSNSANVISNELTLGEKRLIADQARLSRGNSSWSSILW